MPETTLGRHIYHERRKELLLKSGYSSSGAILVFGLGGALGANTQSHGAIRYLTGWDSHEDFSLLVITDDCAHLLINSPFMAPMASANHPELNIIQITSSGWGQCVGELLTMIDSMSIIGFEEAPYHVYQQIMLVAEKKTLGYSKRYLDKMRLIKALDEIVLYESAATICEKLFQLLPDVLSTVQPCYQTQLILETEAKRLGADYCSTWLTVNSVADRPRYWPKENQHFPCIGDQVIFGVALTVDGHWAHGIRMGSIGPAELKHQEVHKLVMSMLDAGIDALRPGDKLSQVEASINKVLSKHYLPQKMDSLVRFRNGHGLGMSYEDPLVSDCFPQHFGVKSSYFPHQNNDLIIQPGMILELHPNAFFANYAGGAIGEMLLVDQAGARPMITTPRDLFEVSDSPKKYQTTDRK